jgi:hypothetical protein
VAPTDRGANLYLTQALDQAAEPHIRALRYGLNVENLPNREDGRRPLPYTPLTPPKD